MGLYYVVTFIVSALVGITCYFLLSRWSGSEKTVLEEKAKAKRNMAIKLVLGIAAMIGLLFGMLLGGRAVQNAMFIEPEGGTQMATDSSMAPMAFGAVFPSIILMVLVISLFPVSTQELLRDASLRKAWGEARVRRFCKGCAIAVGISLGLFFWGMGHYSYYKDEEIVVTPFLEVSPRLYRVEDVQDVEHRVKTGRDGGTHELFIRMTDGYEITMGWYLDAAQELYSKWNGGVE